MVPRRSSLLAALVLLLSLAVPTAASAAPREAFGVDVGQPLDMSTEELRTELRQAQQAGAKVVRFDLLWNRVQPGRDRFDDASVAKLDAAFREVARRKMRVLGLFIGTPCWASAKPAADGRCGADPIADPASAVSAATFLARRYATQLVGFELWNEPDQRNELYWAGGNKVNRYVALARALYAPLKQAAPGVPVLAGAFVGSDGRWLEALYAAGIKGHYDALSVHFYDLTLTSLRTIRAVQTRNGDTAPIFLGETGWGSCRYRASFQDGHLCTTQASQARQTADLVRALRRTSWVSGVVLFTLKDDAQYDFGLFDRNGRMKPVARTLKAELRTKRPRRTRAVRLSVRAVGGRLRVTGIGPGADFYTVEAVSPRGRFRATTRLTAGGRLAVTVPPELGTRGVVVRLRHLWTGAQQTRRT